ncbi:hypothetical protein BofuT4_uP025790.1 [Botrytis cinerea T4]|uniref:Uncharacterized protein n=1 Tax=Botryotinia fuckeliana (strain T4) TaxID=999810 RepID=G2YEI2_BOTF4|nr:hypothetical protein BofuT4_uP025790.1 [Botrytis cinerea T4]
MVSPPYEVILRQTVKVGVGVSDLVRKLANLSLSSLHLQRSGSLEEHLQSPINNIAATFQMTTSSATIQSIRQSGDVSVRSRSIG